MPNVIRARLRYDYGVMPTQVVQPLELSIEGEGPHNMAAQLHANLPSAQMALLKAVAEEASKRSAALYLLGGPVRDLLLGIPVKDFDLVLEGNALALARELVRRFGGEMTEHKRFGTAKWRIMEIKDALSKQLGDGLAAEDLPDSLDLVSARQESYPQVGALPEVTFARIEQDSQRRDFTLNTLALRLDGAHFGELIDLWDGLADLRAGRLRVLHARSFVDDPTRILRALRFATRFTFQMEEQTMAWLSAGLKGLEDISGERIRNELDLMLGEAKGVAMLSRLQEVGVLQFVQPDLRFDEGMSIALSKLPDNLPEEDWGLKDASLTDLGYVLWLMQLDPQAAEDVSKRLSLESGLSKAIVSASQARGDQAALQDAKASKAVALLEGLPPLARYALYLQIEDESLSQILLRYETEWRHLWPETNGKELLRRGLAEGPRFKEILTYLRTAWLDGKINSAEEEEKLLEQLLDE